GGPMARYYLKNPKNNGDILVRHGQSWDEPIYKGRDTNDFFILKWGRSFTRELFPFDPSTGTITGKSFPVPDNWAGEPRVLGIDEDLWHDLPGLAENDSNAANLLQELSHNLIEGDTIRLTRDGAATGYLRAKYQNGQWVLIGTGSARG